jgi:uncharacterized membrane protein YqaE (UPF0057 family)
MNLTIILIGLVLYFLPTFLGSGKRGAGGIFVLNTFLGWTILGWIGALIWAVTAEKKY